MKKNFSEEQKRLFENAGSKIRGFLKQNRINNTTEEYLPLKRAVQFKMINPEKTFEELVQDIVDVSVSPRCSTVERTKNILANATEEFLLDVKLTEKHQQEYDALKTEEEQVYYVICLIAEASNNFRE